MESQLLGFAKGAYNRGMYAASFLLCLKILMIPGAKVEGEGRREEIKEERGTGGEIRYIGYIISNLLFLRFCPRSAIAHARK